MLHNAEFEKKVKCIHINICVVKLNMKSLSPMTDFSLTQENAPVVV